MTGTQIDGSILPTYFIITQTSVYHARAVLDVVVTGLFGAIIGTAVSDKAARGAILGALLGSLIALLYHVAFAVWEAGIALG